MIKRNLNFKKLSENYLFLEINKRKDAFLTQNPSAQLISLGIGDTTEPLDECIIKAIMHTAVDLGVRELYTGYGPEQGLLELREKISKVYYKGQISPEEIFISDGAKCDVARLQTLFGPNVRIGVQDPAYPVYIDGSQLQGVSQVARLPCSPENDFFPDLDLAQVDVLYICSPNNPTGTVLSKAQLKSLVKYAETTQTLIVFDAAYSCFIRDDKIPKSIFEIKGAENVAIEVNSFSKSFGFTGVRAGWSVIPKALKYMSGESILKDYQRVNSTLFNGASILSQKAALKALSKEGLKSGQETCDHYLKNASLLKESLLTIGFSVYGGEHAPYLWISIPEMKSWEAFDLFLNEAHLITTPGIGFGESGEGYVRLSAFGSRKNILEAQKRLIKLSESPRFKLPLKV